MREWPLNRAPDKTLREILKVFETRDLYKFALVSKRLHCVALPIIFRRHGFTEETQTIELTLPRDVIIGGFLDALRVALTMCVDPAVSLFKVDFEEPHLATDFYRIFDVISKLSAIRAVDLAFEDANATHSADEQRWATVFDMLCTTLKTKSCSRLQVTRKSHGDTQVYHVLVSDKRSPPESRRARSVGLIRNFVGLPAKAVQSSSSRVNLIQDPTLEDKGISPGRRLALYSLEVTQSRPFLEEAIPHTLKSLSTLRVLRLVGETRLGAPHLSRIAEAAPHLTTLVVSTMYIRAKHLLDFISKLSKLKELIIQAPRAWVPQSVWEPKGKPLKFPALTRICAPPAHVFPLLAGGNERALPSLHSLELVLPLELYFFKCYQPVLSQVMAALQANPRTDSILPTLIVNFDTEFLWSPIEDCLRYTLDEYLIAAVGNKTAFERPRKMVITGFSDAKFSAEVVFVILPRWLGLFKGLRHLTFSAIGCCTPIYPPARLIRAIHKQCPYIESVTIKGMRHDVIQLLKEEGPALSTAGQDSKLMDDICDFGEHSVSTTVQREKKGELQVFTDVSALRPRSSGQPIEHISCRMPPAPAHRFIIYEFLHQFHQVILSLPSVNRVTLDFTNASLVPLSVKPASESCKIHWTALVISLLQAICARSCTSLTIHGGAFLSDLTVLPPLTPTPTPADGDGNDGSGEGDEPQPQPAWYPPPPPPSLTTAHLERLELDSEALSLSPVRFWLHFTLQAHPTGKDISHLLIPYTPTRPNPAPALALELPALAHAVFSGLTALTLAYPSAEAPLPAYIPSVLHALPHLTALDLDGSCPVQAIVGAPPPMMRRLRRLAAPAEYIVFLLTGAAPGAGARLAHLTLYLPFASGEETVLRLCGVAGVVDRLLAERLEQVQVQAQTQGQGTQGQGQGQGQVQVQGKPGGRHGGGGQKLVRLGLGLHLPITCAEWMHANMGDADTGTGTGTDGWEAFARGVGEISFRELGTGTSVAAATVQGSGALAGLGAWLARGWFPVLRRVEFQPGLVARHMDKDLGEMGEACVGRQREERRFEGVVVGGVWRWVREGVGNGAVVGGEVGERERRGGMRDKRRVSR